MRVCKTTDVNEEKIFDVLMKSFIAEYEYYTNKKYTQVSKPMYTKKLNSKLGSARSVCVCLSKFESAKHYEVTTKFGDEINVMSYQLINTDGINQIVYEEKFYYESGKKNTNNALMQLIWLIPNKMNAKKRLKKLELIASTY